MPSLPQPCWRDNSRTSQSVSEPVVVTPMRLPLRSPMVLTGVSKGSTRARLAGGPYMAATPIAGAPLARKPSPGPEPSPTSTPPAASACCSWASPRKLVTSISIPSFSKTLASLPTSIAPKANELGPALPSLTLSSATAALAGHSASAASRPANAARLSLSNISSPLVFVRSGTDEEPRPFPAAALFISASGLRQRLLHPIRRHRQVADALAGEVEHGIGDRRRDRHPADLAHDRRRVVRP